MGFKWTPVLMSGINNKCFQRKCLLYNWGEIERTISFQQKNNEHRLRGSPNLTVHFPQNVADVFKFYLLLFEDYFL
jgi:hypothetical protein